MKIFGAVFLALFWLCLSSASQAGPEKVRLEIEGGEMDNTSELSEFRELVVKELTAREISVVQDNAAPLLLVMVGEFNKEWLITKMLKWVTEIKVGGPWAHYTSNKFHVLVFLKDNGKETEFEEFREFREKSRSWRWMRQRLAARIADAVFYHH